MIDVTRRNAEHRAAVERKQAESAELGALWGLYWAMYASGAEWRWWETAPELVGKAYIRVQQLLDEPKRGAS